MLGYIADIDILRIISAGSSVIKDITGQIHFAVGIPRQGDIGAMGNSRHQDHKAGQGGKKKKSSAQPGFFSRTV